MRCKFCVFFFLMEGPYRVKHHSAGTGRDVQPCRMVPPNVKKAKQFLIWLELVEMKRALVEMINLF